MPGRLNLLDPLGKTIKYNLEKVPVEIFDNNRFFLLVVTVFPIKLSEP